MKCKSRTCEALVRAPDVLLDPDKEHPVFIASDNRGTGGKNNMNVEERERGEDDIQLCLSCTQESATPTPARLLFAGDLLSSESQTDIKVLFTCH